MMQNLLSKQAKKNNAQEYYLRLGAVGLFSISLAVIVGLFALLPVYMSLIGELNTVEAEQLAKGKDSQRNEELQKEIEQGEFMVSFLEADSQKEKLTNLVQEVLRVRPEGVSITGFSYARSERMLTFEGVAATRDLVIPFARALETNQYFENVHVPIANLAKNTNLDFHLTISLSAPGEGKTQ